MGRGQSAKSRMPYPPECKASKKVAHFIKRKVQINWLCCKNIHLIIGQLIVIKIMAHYASPYNSD